MHAMMDKLGYDLDTFVTTSNPEDEIDRDGKLKRDKNGAAVIAFGKHAGKPLSKIPRDYLQWITEKDFSQSTKAAVRRYLATGIL